MAVKYAIINPTDGFLRGVISPAQPHSYVAGGLDSEGNLVQILPDSIEPLYAVENMRWNGNTFADAPQKPGEHYNWSGVTWVFDSEAFMEIVREARNTALSLCDWTQIPDASLTTEQKAEWATYRQQLRDITDNLTGSETTIEDAPWPSAP